MTIEKYSLVQCNFMDVPFISIYGWKSSGESDEEFYCPGENFIQFGKLHTALYTRIIGIEQIQLFEFRKDEDLNQNLCNPSMSKV